MKLKTLKSFIDFSDPTSTENNITNNDFDLKAFSIFGFKSFIYILSLHSILNLSYF